MNPKEGFCVGGKINACKAQKKGGLGERKPLGETSAIADRIDEVLEFLLPRKDERLKLLKLYLDMYIAQEGTKSGFFSKMFSKAPQKKEIDGLLDDVFRELAARIEGFSGREIAKLMASVQAACYGSRNRVLDATLYREVVDYKVAEHQKRHQFADLAEFSTA